MISSMMLDSFRSWFSRSKAQIKTDLFAFLRFPSVSSEQNYQKSTLECADWLCNYLKKSGINSAIFKTSGFPIVYGEVIVEEKLPTVLIYGHYDVQPVTPLESWKGNPFDPIEIGEEFIARGAVDDKGQIFYAIQAVRCLVESKQLPVNIKFCIEGEEEIGSPSLQESLIEMKEKLKADSLLIVDFGAMDSKTPAIHLGTRGLLTFEIVLTGASIDLHSGLSGGIAYNPNRALVELLSKMVDSDGKVTVDGFYDGVKDPTSKEKQQFTSGLSLDFFQKDTGIVAYGGESGYSPEESNFFRPTLEINGISGGYTGNGFKTVIPAEACAKVSCRLVPGQDPERIGKLIEDFIQNHSPLPAKVTLHKGSKAFRSSENSRLALSMKEAATQVCSAECKTLLTGASIPVITELTQTLSVDTVGFGFGLISDGMHAPNEKFDFTRFEKGFLTIAGALINL
jgi:acetylornithine deacetylase/succinyl-diaminopimelate desuccinylase-like protein